MKPYKSSEHLLEYLIYFIYLIYLIYLIFLLYLIYLIYFRCNNHNNEFLSTLHLTIVVDTIFDQLGLVFNIVR